MDEGTFIRVGNLSLALYDGFGRIIVENRLITSTSYRGIYVRVSLDDHDYQAFYKPPQEFTVEVQDGVMLVHDSDFFLIAYREELEGFELERDGETIVSFEDAEFVLMVLVAN